jgi:hypothetical protein
MQITAVGTEEPFEPRRWQDAAKIAVSLIFDSTAAIMSEELQRPRVISSQNFGFSNPELEEYLAFQDRLDIQFEGMINTSKWFEADEMYWAQEWKMLGAIATSGGMKNGSFLPDPAAGGNQYKKLENLSASGAGVFDSWMIREQITETLIRKQHDYGHHNISRFGRHGLLVRVHDKIARLKNLMLKSASPNNESISDTYTDIVGYSAIGIMWERGWFGLELEV